MPEKEYTCPLELAMDVIGRRWKSLIIWHLSRKDYRSGELLKQIPDISKKVYLQQLKELERDRIISRTEGFEGKIPVTKFQLTEYGHSLLPLLEALRVWGENHKKLVLNREEGTGLDNGSEGKME